MKAWVLAAAVAMACASRGEESQLIDLRGGDRLVARYQPAVSPMKPYVKELYSPEGVQVTVDSPPDHFHHHGLMFAIGAGDVDFWTEKPFEKFGKQVPWTSPAHDNAEKVGQGLQWTAPDGNKLLVETRVLHVWTSKEGGANVLTWNSTLDPFSTVKLWGRHYFGLGIRFPADMDGRAAFLLAPDAQSGRVVRSDEAVRAASWCAAAGSIGGKPVTVAMWDDPANVRRAAWFTMSKPFSYLSATLDLEQQPLSLEAGRPLKLRYAVAVFDGTADAARIEKARADWLAADAQP